MPQRVESVEWIAEVEEGGKEAEHQQRACRVHRGIGYPVNRLGLELLRVAVDMDKTKYPDRTHGHLTDDRE